MNPDQYRQIVMEMLTTSSISLFERYEFQESDEDNSDEELFEYEIMGSTQTSISMKDRQIWRIQNYVEIVSHYSDITFKSHFRMSKTTVEAIIVCVNSTNYQSSHKAGKAQVDTQKAILMTVWYLSNTETFRQISDRFDISFSTAHITINRVLDFLVHVKDKYIRWPRTPDRIRDVNEDFKKKKGFKKCIGVIDGCHIPINRPVMHEEYYVNRKGHHSLLLQGIATPDKQFSNVYCGEPGSLHDARLLKKSYIYKEIIDNPNFFEDNYILGDSAYPNLNWLIVPYKDNGQLDRRHKFFNYKHSSTRITIEHAFGLLKGRFRRLHKICNTNLDLCVKIIMAACVLHNITIINKDNTVISLYQDEDIPAEYHYHDYIEIENRREQLLNELCP